MTHRRPSLEREVALWDVGRTVVAGLDEAGRGPLAGPVVAAAVVFPPGCPRIRGLDDSKRCTARQRERLALLVRERALAVAVGAASVHEIDRFNIRRASILAMRRALTRLAIPPAAILVDGLPCPELGLPHEAIIDGDALCYSIAAASLILGHRQDGARSPDDAVGAALPGLRLGPKHGLRHGVASRCARRPRPHAAPPP